MSTTPKGPHPDEGGEPNPAPAPQRRPDQTFLGVAPAAPTAPPKAPGGSAIIAAPMIAVSGSKPAASQPPSPPAAQPAPPAGSPLAGGWQSASVPPRGAMPDRTLLHASPQAAPARPAPAPGASPWQSSPPPAQPTAFSHGAFPRPDAASGSAPPPAPAPAPQRQSLSDAPGNRTALASDYLRAARDAALGVQRETPRDRTPPPPAPLDVRPAAAAPVRAPEPAVARMPEPPPSVPAPVTVPPVTAPPPTAPPESPMPEPRFARAASAQPAPNYEHEGPLSMGTQASVAPPMEGGSHARSPVVVSPPEPVIQSAPVAPAPASLPRAPRSMAGTMLEQPSSLPSPGAPASAFGAPSVPAPAQVTRFEPVPSIRAPLGDQGPASFGASVQMDQSAVWDAGNTGAGSPPTAKAKKATAGSQMRLIALAVVAVVAVGFAAFSDQLLGKKDSSTTARRAVSESEPASTTETPAPRSAETPTGQTTLANRPQGEAEPRALGSAASDAPAGAALAPATDLVPAAAAEPAEAETEDAAQEPAMPDDPSASPESKLAASAARHVIAGRFAEALPLYEQLSQASPQTTAYAAMVRVLRQKTGTPAPAPSAAP